ncbi:MAG: arylesterase [Natronospirillum sp.]|uniref:arylesterase n=1 Tax=Natronospirillum sp. TaxID=2812955 RepID=UPI0025D4A175|nr:arylesterase [Natronospirillum sp.]MCH8551515.1 arylesterase [Natronospirillum sp.]
MVSELIRSLKPGVFVLVCLLAAPAQAATVLVMGDSLSTAYGLSDPDQGWVSLLEERLSENRHSVINASISGETTRGGQQRLPGLLDRYQPDYVILELGGNDGLQGQNIPDIRSRLQDMIDQSQDAGADVILLGIRIPPNYGPRYTEPFFNMFGELAESNQLDYFLPFMLDSVAENPDLMQGDGIHPRAEAQPRILDNVWSILPGELKN